MLQDAFLAYLHFAMILMLAGLLFSEQYLYSRVLDRARFILLQQLDMAYGISAGLVVASGLLRMFFGIKGVDFYIHNPIFWTKIGLFIVVALLSIPPTVHIIRLARANPGDGPVMIEEPAYAKMKNVMRAECVILLLIPLFAALMSRGI